MHTYDLVYAHVCTVHTHASDLMKAHKGYTQINKPTYIKTFGKFFVPQTPSHYVVR